MRETFVWAWLILAIMAILLTGCATKKGIIDLSDPDKIIFRGTRPFEAKIEKDGLKAEFNMKGEPFINLGTLPNVNVE